MRWLKAAAALVVCGFLLLNVGMFAFLMAGGSIGAGSAPGLSAADSRALAIPFGDLMAGRDETLRQRIVDPASAEDVHQAFVTMRGLVGTDQPRGDRLVRWQAVHMPAGSQLMSIRELEYPDRVARVTTILQRGRASDPWMVQRIDLLVRTHADLAKNKLSFAGKAPLTIVGMAGMIVILLFCAATAVACIYLDHSRYRWIWLIGILVGVGAFMMNGGNGAWIFQPIHAAFPPATMTWSGSAFEPWYFKLTIPVGAIGFWAYFFISRRKKAATDATSTATF